VTAATTGAQISVAGKVALGGSARALELAIKAEVTDLAGVAKLAGTKLRVPTPLVLSAKLASQKDEQVADPIRLTLGKSTVEGRVAVKTEGPRPYVSARLASKEIELAQVAGPAPKPEAKSGRIFSDAPFPLDALRRLDGDAEIAVERLVLRKGLPLESVRTRVALKNGRFDVQQFGANLGGGAVDGRILLDASKPAAATLAVSFDGKGISLEKVGAALGYAQNLSGGSTDVALRLTGPGESLHRFVGWGNGELRVTIGPTRASGAALDAGGGALTSILDKVNPFRRTDPHTDLSCAVVRLPVRDGVATAQRTIAAETTKVNMVLAGQINLRTEDLDLAIRPTVKEGLGIGVGAVAELVHVTGTLSDPTTRIDTLASARAALSVGAAVLTSGLSLLGELAYSRATADPHPCQTALAGDKPPKGGPQQLKEETGRFFERLFK